MTRIQPLLRRVLKKAETVPADAALREVLRASSISAEEKRFVSRSVFAYFRWSGWLNKTNPLPRQVSDALELQDQFDRKPGGISDSELLSKALPSWINQVVLLTPDLVREFQKQPRLWLRARPGNAGTLAKALGNASAHPKIDDAIWYKGEQDLYRTNQFHEGAFEIQDLSSQLVGLLCHPSSGETWWDVCAGEGGKTLHLCDLMQNEGLVWASDPANWRLYILKKRAARAGLFNYRVKAWNQSQSLRTRGKFDGVLVDAPCSGVGTWGKNPHARWTTTATDVTELAMLQRDILGRIASSIKPGGKLVYSVCTLTMPETTAIVDWFSNEHPEFQPLLISNPLSPSRPQSVFELLPQELHANGMFVALWQRS
jgi:16S rRNA (cytosine967-C5)-methyltransferase